MAGATTVASYGHNGGTSVAIYGSTGVGADTDCFVFRPGNVEKLRLETDGVLTQTVSNASSTTPQVVLTNTNASGQTPIDCIVNGITRSRIRSDFGGNMTTSINGGGFYWINGGIDSAGTVQMTLVGPDLVVSGNVTSNSDRILKTDIEPLTGSLAAVCAMQGVRYTRIKDGSRQIGLVAQDVEVVRPEYVHTS